MSISNRNLLKSAVMLVLAVALMMTTAVTAFAYDGELGDTGYVDAPYDNGIDSDYGNENIIEEPPIQEPPLGSLVVINSTHEGQLLAGAVFGLYRVGEGVRLAELATDTQGRTQEVPLSQGDYFLVLLMPSHNHMSIVNRVYVAVGAGQRQVITIFSVPTQPKLEPTPEPTPPPVEIGRLLITLRAQGTNQLLSGAVFELRDAMNGEFVAHLTTDMFGEAALDLPVGDYFLREVQNVNGFIPNPDRINVRISANRLNEVNITSQPPPTETQPPQETAPQNGRLILTLTAEGTREPLQGAIFEVRRTSDNVLMAEIITDRFGESAINLSPDDYFLRQITTAQGFEFSTERVNIRIAEGAVREIALTNRPIAPVTPPQDDPPPAELLEGRLLMDVVSAQTGDRIIGAVFGIYDLMTEERVATVLSNSFGEVSLMLPVGNFFMRNIAMPYGYHRNMERVNFSIRANAVTNLAVSARAVQREQPTPTPTQPPEITQVPEPTPPPQVVTPPPAQRPSTTAPNQSIPVTAPIRTPQSQSRVEIITRAEQSGSPLHGATFGVYRAIDSQRVGEVTTDANGRAIIALSSGEYYLRNTSVQFGFLQERSRIFFTVATDGNVAVEVTIQRDANIPYADYGVIDLPPTGELTPVLNYALGSAFLAIALLCLIGAFKQDKHNRSSYKGVKSYA